MSEVRYEKSDVRVSGVFAFAAGLILLGFGVYVCVTLLFDLFRERSLTMDDSPPASALKRVRLPRDVERIPKPVLQQDEAGDLQRLREREETHLKIARVPIDEAMHLLADPKFAERHGIRVEQRKKGGQ